MSVVTVVVPVWDGYCSFLEECVAGALAQETASGRLLPPRVLVVDNASETPLPPLPREIAVVRAPERLSAGAARNLGLAHVRTPLVCFLDADDLLLPGALGRACVVLSRRPRAVAAVARYESWNPESDERRMLARSPRPVVFAVSRFPRLFALANLRWNSFPVAGGVHRTAAVLAAGGFGDASVGEDWILGTQLAFRGPIEFLRTPGFVRRVHSGSLWHRGHGRDEYVRRGRLLRQRLRLDPAVPRWVKALLPALALVHRFDARSLRPANPLLGEAR